MDLITTVRALKKGNLQRTVEKRLKEFAETGKQGEERWFSELCFCILTANSKARTAISIQDDLGPDGFIECSQGDVSACIRKHKHRFHNNKSRYIIEARQHIPIRKNITEMISKKGVVKTREWIARTIKGIGFKEASHFLRNVGYDGIAILDRHILNLMVEHRYIQKGCRTCCA